MSDNNFEVIDLTSSYTLANHFSIADEIINVDSDESFDIETRTNVNSSRTSNLRSIKDKHQNTVKKGSKPEENSPKFGDCPICWNKLGKKPLASTKCGHVYCLKCLEKSLLIEKQCPICRCKLKGKTAYHPLYLSSN